MHLSGEEQFKILAQQLNLKEIPQGLIAAKLKKLVVHENSKQWEFNIELPALPDVKEVALFSQQLTATFQQIATTHFQFHLHEQPALEEVVRYWAWILQQHQNESGAFRPAFEHVAAEVIEGNILLRFDSQFWLNYAQTTGMALIGASYRQLGIQDELPFKLVLDEQMAQDSMAHLLDQKAEDERILAQQARENLVAQRAGALERQKESEKNEDAQKSRVRSKVTAHAIGKGIPSGVLVSKMAEVTMEADLVTFEGYVFDSEIRELKSGRKLAILKMSDYTDSFILKKFLNQEAEEPWLDSLKNGGWYRVRGNIREDSFSHDLTMMFRDIEEIPGKKARKDTYDGAEKRVDLQVHSIMSTMDATSAISEYINTAASWGMRALAVTDTAGAQAFPEASSTASKVNAKLLTHATHAYAQQQGEKIADDDELKAFQKAHLDDIKTFAQMNGDYFKMIYGVEINLVDDGTLFALNTDDTNLDDAEYVVFDVETTGLAPRYDKVIQLSAVKMQKGNVIDEFDEYINPHEALSPIIMEITHITDNDLRQARSEAEVFADFQKFYGDAILVGHNVIDFDIPMVDEALKRNQMTPLTNVVIDTLPLARFLHPEMRRFTLGTLAKKLGIPLEHAHNAIYDATATGHVARQLLQDARERYGVTTANQLNEHINDGEPWRHERPKRATVLVKNQTGVKNLYKLISDSNVKYLDRMPRTPRSLLEKYREGLIVGTGDASGEFFETLERKGKAAATKLAEYYDYIEVQPPANYSQELAREMIKGEERLHEILTDAVEIGHELGKPVVVSGDAHYLDPEDAIYRKILINSQGGANMLNRYPLPDVHFRTTAELLADFSFLGEQTAQEIVVHNTNVVADQIESVEAIKSGNYPPNMPTAEQEIRDKTYTTAYAMYGKPLPLQIEARIERELASIIGNGFAVIYLVAQRLVAKSNKDGYLVGSRGSVGSSLVALLAGITEVNALAPHYYSRAGDYVEFVDPRVYGSGYSIPMKNSPLDESPLIGDGHNIPFETFLGFKGNKVPDIDLNFSGDYQPFAHNYMKSLFGENNVFRAGTIATVADKTAFGYVKAYERDLNEAVRKQKQKDLGIQNLEDVHLSEEEVVSFKTAEIERLAAGATGVKRTTGQHPAGILIVPDDMEIYDFTPIQFPADDVKAKWKTTHFDFHSIHDNILKMDILGHDDPTMIRALQDMSGIDPKTIPMNDEGVMSLFQSPDVLGVKADDIFSKTGTLGVPEFGTAFVRGMLQETNPKSYADLLQISGLSHGTDVWRGNADELIQRGLADISTVIGTRDKIMTDLINEGVNPESAFQIMEKVRKGKGVSDAYQAELRTAGVQEWYIDSLKKIQYMFPLAHAAAYVLMALRIAYFKVYFPTLYYAAYFSVRASNFDIVTMARGSQALKGRITEIHGQGLDASAKDRDLVTVLEIANEATERGINFGMVDLYQSDSEQWVISGDTLIAPFNAVPSLGDNVAKRIIAARADGEFLSKEDLAKRGGVSQTLMQFFEDNGVVDGMSDENQMALF
ncbi:PolC-type DNA polymerase III [Weissella diestrammenae]|uniref:DNA polymerase III PolC-type n=1 Tax=Weissella diestrammenae TaxID=1162633 RepID=A0A7G9T3X5_9LACO|nr:PolC-type DNA polymerase III [Weissella diestrammenae]MCM0582127.1 PolC-type DNA polymerase III [Weissella diestrammenae]QNN74800.1 PolC-type DNA polymerase III [Weissella diestrammenae]